MVIFSPLLGVIFSPLYALAPLILFINVLFHIILDAGQKYLGIMHYFLSYFEKQDLKILTVIPILLILFSFGFYYQIDHIWMLFFYMILIHFLWQTDWFFEAQLNNSNPLSTILRIILSLSLIFTIGVIHFSPTNFIALNFQEGPLGIESSALFKSGIIIDSSFYLLTCFGMIFVFVKKHISAKALAYFLSLTFFFRFIFYSPYLGGDPLFVLISIHALPFFFYNFSRFQQDFSQKKIFLLLLIMILFAYIDVELLVDNLDLDINYLDTRPSWQESLGSSFYLNIHLLHLICVYFLRKRMPLTFGKQSDVA